MPRIREDRSAPPRTVTIDSNLGEALCHLNVAVHFEIAKVEGVLGLRSDHVPRRIRRCQTCVSTETKEWVRFAPGGESDAYFLNYIHRIGASGNKEFLGLWPILADFRGIYLSGADLTGAGLRYADLSYADLSGTDLSGAYLHGADLKA